MTAIPGLASIWLVSVIAGIDGADGHPVGMRNYFDTYGRRVAAMSLFYRDHFYFAAVGRLRADAAIDALNLDRLAGGNLSGPVKPLTRGRLARGFRAAALAQRNSAGVHG